jgi:hypothetical protein
MLLKFKFILKYHFSLLSIICMGIVQAQIPRITAVNPLAGYRGSSINISGSHFNSNPANNVVFFGSVRGNVTAAASSSVTVTVPPNATYDRISITTSGLTAFSTLPFIASFPSNGTINQSSFSPRVNFTTQEQPGRMAQGDLTGDGKIDLIVSNWFSNTLSIYRNIETGGSLDAGSFDDPKIYDTGSRPNEVAIGDLDGDGKLDMIVCNINDNTVLVFRNNTAGDSISFDPGIEYTTGNLPFDAAIGDLDGDGKPEFIIGTIGDTTVQVFHNTSTVGNINFEPGESFAIPAFASKIAVGDLDGDNKPELAVACVWGSDEEALSILRNTSMIGAISFNERIDFPSPHKLWNAVVGDLDLDGKLDIVAATDSSANLIVVYRNTSEAGMLSLDTPVTFERGLGYGFLAVGDINGDGRPEVVAANGTSNTISVLRNNTTVGIIDSDSFAPRVDYPSGIYPHTPVIGDFDLDGHADIAFVNNGTEDFPDSSMSVLRNEILEIPLPVELTSFIGSVEGPSIVLKWKTATEVSSSTFEIERRTRNDWKKIGELQASGTSNVSHEYIFIDTLTNIYSRTIRYRLKNIDVDGSYEYSSEIEVVAIPQSYTLAQNYPNPFNPQTKIQYSLPENARVRLSVYDILGRHVAELINEDMTAGYYEKTFNGSHLSSGIYFYHIAAQVQGKNAFMQVKKMLLVK